MDLAILDPSILYISEEDWFDDEIRDNYIDHFKNMLNGIHENENLALAWCDKFEELLWCFPQKLPWMMDKCWSNTIIPFIYERMQKNAKFIKISETATPCEINPNIYYDREDLYSLFLVLLAVLHNRYNRIVMCFGLKNIPTRDHKFRVDGEYLIPDPIFVTGRKDFLKLIDVVESCWPTRAP